MQLRHFAADLHASSGWAAVTLHSSCAVPCANPFALTHTSVAHACAQQSTFSKFSNLRSQTDRYVAGSGRETPATRSCWRYSSRWSSTRGRRTRMPVRLAAHI